MSDQTMSELIREVVSTGIIGAEYDSQRMANAIIQEHSVADTARALVSLTSALITVLSRMEVGDKVWRLTAEIMSQAEDQHR